MKSHTLFALALFAFFFTACEKDDDNLDQVTNTLQANAGTVENPVEVGEILNLDGSASKDNAGRPFTYLWSIKSQPQESQADLEDETTPTPKLTPDVEGDYVIELKISNNQFSDTDEISFTATVEEGPLAIIINADIAQDRRLMNVFDDPELPDYIVTRDIHVTALLQIDPGVTIAFEEDQAMYIDNPGAIIGFGSGMAEIKFTGKEATPGFWKGLIINSGSSHNQLENVVIEYGGSSAASGLEEAANLVVNSEGPGNLTIARSRIQYSGSYGVVVEPGSTVKFQSSISINNNEVPLRLSASHVSSLSNEMQFSNNTRNTIEVTGSTINAPGATYWIMHGTTPYFISGKVQIASGLHISQGTTLLFDEHAEMQIISNGYLSAVGTEIYPIKFLGAEPSAGYWKGVAFRNNNVNNELKFTEVSGAGSELIEDNVFKAAVSITGENGAPLKMSESKITKSGGYGLYVNISSSLADFGFNLFESNLGPAIAVPANEVEKFRAHPAISYLDNGHNGVEIIYSSLSSPINAESIWAALPFGATYLVGGNIAVNTGLKILPGAVFKFKENAMLGVFQGGYLDAEGFPDTKITFTGASETKGFWNGILIRSNSDRNKLIHTEILYAGKTPMSGPNMAASIALDPDYYPKMTIRNSRIAHGLGYGIVMYNNRSNVNEDVETANQFEDLGMGNVYK